MRIILIIALYFIPLTAFGQSTFYINDNPEQYNVLSSWDSKMVDHNSSKFIQAKKNVLAYCNERLNFNLDSISIKTWCRAYSKINDKANKKDQKFARQNGLKFEFSMALKINKTTTYSISFYLDSLLQVSLLQ